MTTIQDYARDLVISTVRVLVEKKNPDKLKSEIDELVDEEISAHEIDDLVDEFISIIKSRIVGE